jgi:glucose-1-phosphate adenylyltransferase
VDFEEKPACPKLISDNPPTILASMGIYVFNRSVLTRALATQPASHANMDFARDIIPSLLKTGRVHAYRFGAAQPSASQYWRDVGTINSYYDAGMELLNSEPLFDLYEDSWPIRAGEFNRGTRHLQGAHEDSIVSSSARVEGDVHHSVVSSGVVVEQSAIVRNSILLPGARVGKGAVVNGAILDEHAHVSEGETIGLDLERDRRRFTITDRAVVVVPYTRQPTRETPLIRPRATFVAPLVRTTINQECP